MNAEANRRAPGVLREDLELEGWRVPFELKLSHSGQVIIEHKNVMVPARFKRL